jgi:thiol-disulfide isomerase/thioredoxin
VILLPLVALLLAAPAGKPAAKTAGAVHWERSFDAALAKAKSTGKPVMIDFWAEWCGYCHLLDRTTYRDPTVVRRSANFVSVKVDSEGSDAEVAIASRYLVGSLPTILFVSPAGRPILRLHGYIPPERFAPALSEATKRAPLVMTWEAALEKDPQNAEALATLGLHSFNQLTLMAQRDGGGRMSKQMFEDTKDLLTRAYRVDKDRPPLERKRVRSSLGILHGYGGQFPESAAMLKEAIALSPVNAEIDTLAYSKLGEVYALDKKNDLARQTFRKLIERHPESEEAAMAREYLQGLESAPR